MHILGQFLLISMISSIQIEILRGGLDRLVNQNKHIFIFTLKEKSGAETAPGWSRFHVHRMAPI